MKMNVKHVAVLCTFTAIMAVSAAGYAFGVMPSLFAQDKAMSEDKKMTAADSEQKAIQDVQDKDKAGNGKDMPVQKNGDSQSQEAKSDSLWNWFKKGGIFMWPILFSAALGLGFIIERLIFFFRTKFSSKEFIDSLERSISGEDLTSVEAMCAESNNKMGQIIQKGLQFKALGYDRVEKAMSVAGSVEVSRMERGLSVLNAVANIAPMLGFLGTVSGMISAFYQIAAADHVSAKIVAAGIMEALITTEAGLIVAIPVLLVYNYFIHRIDGFISDVERLSSDIIERLIKGKESNRLAD
jgi:biopolymer transport protein ExbB